MKKTYIISLLLISLISFSQNESDKVLYDRGMTLQYAHYETELIDMLISSDTTKLNVANRIVNQLQVKAIENYEKLIKEYPESELFINSLYQKAEAEFSIGKYSEAKKTFLKVIDSKQYVGKSLLKLAYISLYEKEYKKALNYIEQIKNLNLKYFCGNDDQAVNSQIEYIEKKCAEGMKN